MVTVLNDANFAQETASELPVLIDFWATWCGPCRMMAPVVDALADERAGSLKVCKVNVDEEPGLANRFGIASIPTFVLMKGGRVAAKAVGYMPREALIAQLGL